MPRKKVIEKQPFEATAYDGLVEIETVSVPERLEQLAREIGQLFSGGVKTWDVKRGNVTIKVKVWEVAG